MTRIVVSNTCGFVLTSNETQSMTLRTAFWKPAVSLRTTNVSSTSMSVTEKLPATSLADMSALRRPLAGYVSLRVRHTRTHCPNLAPVLCMTRARASGECECMLPVANVWSVPHPAETLQDYQRRVLGEIIWRGRTKSHVVIEAMIP